MITRATKAEEISALSDRFGRSKAAFLVDFKGMSVEEVTKLRKTLYTLKSEMRVVRNTLAKRALADHPEMEKAISEAFVGTNAVVFAFSEPVGTAKALADFGKEVEEMTLKTGVMDGKALDEGMIKYLATLPSKAELQAKLLGLFQTPMSKFLGTLLAAPEGFVRVLSAYKDSKEKQS